MTISSIAISGRFQYEKYGFYFTLLSYLIYIYIGIYQS